jgi:hypothetical protein
MTLKDNKPTKDSKGKPILNIQEYKIANFKFRYFDEDSKIKMVLDSINHEGTGDFAAKN